MGPDDPRRTSDRTARWRLSLASHADDGNTVGIELDGAILFFEDVHCPPYYVDGELVQLAHAGKLDNVAGGRRRTEGKCDWGDLRQVSDWARSRSIEDVLEERLEPLGVPVLYGLPLGHGKHLAALPLGVSCTLDADARTLTVDEAALR